MGSYTFKWPHAGEEVYVTGSFDDWSKSEKMDKVGDGFEKTVKMPDSADKIYYKYVVDGSWTTNRCDPQEKDESGNENNVLRPEDIIKSAPPTAAIMSTVGPDATTAGLAEKVPLEKTQKPADGEKPAVDLPGAFPETPADELNKPIGISPLPAADGAVNPIKLEPGQPIPPELKNADLNAHVKLDPESYAKSDALPGAPVDNSVLPPATKNMIPESSLPVGASGLAPTVNSVGPDATTLGLAEQVPKEPKVPPVVKESQEKAGAPAGASAAAEPVAAKQEVEAELASKVPEAPTTSEGNKPVLETAAATAAAAGAATIATAVATKDKAVEAVPESVQEKLPEPVKEAVGVAAADKGKEKVVEEVSPQVPAEVKESIAEAGKGPEAAGNTAAVDDKKAVESELKKEVAPVPAVDEQQPSSSSAAKTTANKPKIEEPEPAKETEESTGANGAESAPATPAKDKSKLSTEPAGTTPGSSKSEQKKKHRISGFFGKIRQKIGNKDNTK